MRLAKLCLKLCLLRLVAGLAQQCEHVFLIAFHARLVEGVYAQHIAGDGARLFKEIDEVAKVFFRQAFHLKDDVGHAAVGVGQNGALHGFAVHHAHILARQKVQAVKVGLVGLDVKVLRRGFDIHHGFEQNARAVLHILPHGVKVC